jgi:hypothetical protein
MLAPMPIIQHKWSEIAELFEILYSRAGSSGVPMDLASEAQSCDKIGEWKQSYVVPNWVSQCLRVLMRR